MSPEEPDFVSDLFKRESKSVELIKFSEKFMLRPDKDKIEYLIKLASSLNHAAQQIQKERDELNQLLIKKESQLKKCHEQRDQDRMMIHKQLANENKKQQVLLKENQGLREEIKGLENANID